MTSDRDIYRTANLLIKQHGQDAPIHAAMRADAMLDVVHCQEVDACHASHA